MSPICVLENSSSIVATQISIYCAIRALSVTRSASITDIPDSLTHFGNGVAIDLVTQCSTTLINSDQMHRFRLAKYFSQVGKVLS